MEQVFYEFCFAKLKGIGRKTKRRLLDQYGEQELCGFRDREWRLVLSEKEFGSFCRFRQSPDQSIHCDNQPINIEEMQTEWEKMGERGIRFLSFRSSAYPERLKKIADSPLYLFYRGRLPGPEKALAIVGSRLPTAYGSEMARIFARELARAGVAVISGLAAGIDVAAHRGALEGKGDTFAVLGCGPDMIYPMENFSTYESMLERGGILSEYEPGAKPLAYRFPERNRLISGLSDGVFIVEARGRSGSLITADCGLEQGKEIYALPGRATDSCSQGTNWLIRQGARLVTEPAHILEDLCVECEKNDNNNNILDKLLDNKEKIVYHCLSLEPKHIGEILDETGLSVSEGISILFRLELNGYVKQVVKDYYILVL